MKHIPVIFAVLLAGCATTSLEELKTEARECVDRSTNEMGVIGASAEQRTACWVGVNEKLDVIAKREEEREAEKSKCGGRLVEWCDWTGCRCVTRESARRTLGRMR